MKRKLLSTMVLILVAIIISVAVSYLFTNFENSEIYSAKNSDEFTERLNKALPSWMEKYKVPGLAIGLIQDDKIIWQQGYGFADKESNTKITTDTIFRIASVSKPIAAWGIMHLVEEGKIDLDAPVEKYLTRWHIPESKFDSKGVTIRRLLSHTAGFTVEGSPGYDPDKPLPTIEQSLSGIAGEQWALKIVNEPGTTFKYSGGGFSILQLVIEEVTGQKFADYIQSEICKPLNLNHTRYDRNFEKGTVIATAYVGTGKAIVDRPWIEQASAGVYTSVTDLATFTASCMQNPDGNPAGRGILKTDTLEEMFLPQLNTESSFGVYGLGFIPQTLKNGERLVSHSGDIVGWNAQMAFLPDKKSGIVILTNSDAGYYFKYDVLGVWSKWITGCVNNDTNFLKNIQRTIIMVACFLGVLFVHYVYRIIKQVKSGKRIYSPIFNRKFNLKYLIKPILSVMLLVIWYIVFYADILFKCIFKLDNYMLFTFFSPEFFWITLIVILWGSVSILLNLFTRVCPQKNQ